MRTITREMLTDESGAFRPDWWALAISNTADAEPATDWTADEYAQVVEAEVARRGIGGQRWGREVIEQDVWVVMYEQGGVRQWEAA